MATRPNPPASQPQGGELQPASQALNVSERFTAKVMKEFGGSVGTPQVTEFQKRLIQGYFIAIDRALKTAEEERLRKNDSNSDHRYDNTLPITWENVNLNDLALDVVHYARMGLDMMQDNYLFPIPFKNNKAQKYDVNLMPGYNGIQYIAEKYAFEPPKAVTIELVYATDTFRPIKKSSTNHVEGYEFTINNPFDRGEVQGGFGYIEYEDPAKNKLIIMTLKDIEKRKPRYASANFWGGTVQEWQTVDGKRRKVDVEKPGWFEEMCLKTIKREVYSAKHMPRDPQKIDDAYQYMKLREAKMAELEAQDVIDAYANGDIIDTTPQALPDAAAPELPAPREGFEVNRSTGEVVESAPVTAAPSARAATADGQTTIGGPAF